MSKHDPASIILKLLSSLSVLAIFQMYQPGRACFGVPHASPLPVFDCEQRLPVDFTVLRRPFRKSIVTIAPASVYNCGHACLLASSSRSHFLVLSRAARSSSSRDSCTFPYPLADRPFLTSLSDPHLPYAQTGCTFLMSRIRSFLPQVTNQVAPSSSD